MTKLTHFVIRERDGELREAHPTPAAMALAIQRRLEKIIADVTKGYRPIAGAFDFQVAVILTVDEAPKDGGS